MPVINTRILREAFEAKAAARERLERTARIVAGGTCPHARRCGSVPVIYCDKPVNPITGTHTDGTEWHRATTWLSAWRDDDAGAFVE